MKLGIVIPWREQPSRIKPFEEVKKWYKENFPEAKMYFPDRKGEFWNPSGTRNDGMRMAESDGCDIIIFNDADTIPQIKPLREAIASAARDNFIHTAYTQFRLLGKNGTEEYFDGRMLEKCSHQKYLEGCFGINVCTPQAWWRVGGMDEKFLQWGYEDTCMNIAHKVINGRPFIKHDGIGFGLSHEEQPRSGDKFNNNKMLHEEYLETTSPRDMLKLVERKELFRKESWKELKIFALVHLYPPMNNSGGEIMLHQILHELQSRGHKVKVMCSDPTVTEYDGIELAKYDPKKASEYANWSDIMFTQFDFTKVAMQLANGHRPLVSLIHNDNTIKRYKINRANVQLLVANSQWVKDTIATHSNIVVVHPTIDINKYRVKPGQAITLINLDELKGGNTFWQLARILPEYKFIGVKGGYGDQIIYDKDLPNVTIYENTPDINSIYKQTRILLMPSSYESWGRVAMEAACSGIPTICTPTPGLKESLDYAGIFVDHGDIAGYVEAIRKLDNKKEYSKASELAYKRALDLKPKEELDMLEQKLLRLLKK